MPYFWHSNWHYFGYILRKVAKPHSLESPQKSLKTRPHSYQYGHPLRNNDPLKLWKICVFFWGGAPFFKKNIADIWNFWWIKYLGKGLSYLKNWGVGVNYCWNYGLSKLLLHFIEYCLDQLNSKHTKTAVNSTIQYFEGCSRKRCLLKVWGFLVNPTQNGGPVKVLRNWAETIF